jgi:hypothetical protein
MHLNDGTASMTKVLRLVALLMTVAILASCGNRKAPTGGRKDTINPTVLAVQPDEYADIYESDITITFSKPIERNTILTGLYIYPPVSQKKFRWDGAELRVRIYEELERQTNYYLSLSPEIMGEHGNPLDTRYTWVFRSGHLQENVISGSISYEDPADMGLPIICNLMTADSTLIYTTELSGAAYRFQDLNFQQHIIEAFIDKNENNRYNNISEPYCHAVVEAGEFATVPLQMAYIDTIAPTMQSVTTVSNRELRVRFSEPLSSLQALGIATADSVRDSIAVKQFVVHEDEVSLITETELDTLEYLLHAHLFLDAKDNLQIHGSLPFSGSAEADTTAPVLQTMYPRNGATLDELSPILKASFNEIIMHDSLRVELRQTETGSTMPLQILSSHADEIHCIPAEPLQNYTSYTWYVWVMDNSHNKLKKPIETLFIPLSR